MKKPAIELDQMHAKILLLKRTAEELEVLGEDFPAVARNIVRLLASLKMLEINVSDVVGLQAED